MIWHTDTYTVAHLNELGKNTLGAHIGITFTAIGSDFLQAKMPVNVSTKQPMGLLHGGASAALAETIGSVAGWMCIDNKKQNCVGLEINCNHIRGIREGWVYATASPLHIGATTQVWDIRIKDEKERLICVSRLTLAVIKKR